MPGRPPKSTATLKLQGTAKPSRLAKRGVEPKPEEGFPQPPDWLHSIAKREWDYIGQTHAPGVLTLVDRGMLGVYCQMMARFELAETADPYVGLPASFISAMASLGGKLGLECSSRTRLGTPPQAAPKEHSAWDMLDDGAASHGDSFAH